MKKQFLILILLGCNAAFSQVKTDVQLQTQADSIKNATTAGFNTATRIGTMHKDVIGAKINKGDSLTAYTTIFKQKNDSVAFINAINAKPSFGDVRDVLRDSIIKVVKYSDSVIKYVTPKNLKDSGDAYRALINAKPNYSAGKAVMISGSNISLDSTQVAFIDTANINLFDINKASIGWYIDQGGNFNYNQAFGIFGESDFIPVTTGVTYYACNYGVLTGGIVMRFATYYDANKNIVSGGQNVSSFTPSGSISFVRFAFANTAFNKYIYFGTIPVTLFNLAYLNKPYRGDQVRSNVRVGINNINEIKKSYNLFNKADATDGFTVSNTNLLQANPVYGISGFIKVKEGVTYVASSPPLSAPIRFTCYYDDTLGYVAGGNSSSVLNFTVPRGVAYVRVTYDNLPTTNKNTFMFQEGLNATTYDQFKHSFKTDDTNYQDSINLPTWGTEKLLRLQNYKTLRSSAYSLILNGDSYIDGNYYAAKVQELMTGSGFTYGGAGWCNFANGDNILVSGSLDNSKLVGTFPTGRYVGNGSTSFGIAGNSVSSVNASGDTINIASNMFYDTIKVVYAIKSGGGNFRWRLNGGSWSTVSTAGTANVGVLSIVTSGAGNAFYITLEAQAVGIEFSGCVGVINANASTQFNLHKAGFTGSQASRFGNTALFANSIAILKPQGVLFTWGTNEQNGNIAPSIMKFYIQRLVNFYKAYDSTIDMIFVAPPETKYNANIYKNREYAKVMFQLANENNGAYYSFANAMGTFSQRSINSQIMSADSVHLGNMGKAVAANMIYNGLVGSQPLQTTRVFGGTISSTVTATTTFVVTIPTQANNTYQVSVQGGNMVSVGGFVTNKTTTSFDYIVPAAITGTVQFDWILKP